MPMSLVKRVKKGYPVFVRNMTTDPPTMIAISFHVPGRKPIELYIPPGPYPYEIYPSRVSKNAILQGADELNHFLETGRLKLVGRKKAKAILSDPDVKEEVQANLQRANNPAEQRRWARSEKKISDGIETETNEDIDMVPGPGVKPSIPLHPANPLQEILKIASGENDSAPSYADYQLNAAGGDTNLHPRVLGLLANFSEDRDTPILRSLKALRSQLKSADFHAIISRTPHGCKTWTWANKQVTPRG